MAPQGEPCVAANSVAPRLRRRSLYIGRPALVSNTTSLAAAIILACGFVAACKGPDQSISASIAAQFDASPSAPANLALVGPSSWTHVCILEPYSTNEAAERTLGFKWDIKQRSTIGDNDGINLLVFIRNQEVVAFTEHRRDKGDFQKLSGRCLERKKATLVRQVGVDGWVHFVSD